MKNGTGCMSSHKSSLPNNMRVPYALGPHHHPNPTATLSPWPESSSSVALNDDSTRPRWPGTSARSCQRVFCLSLFEAVFCDSQTCDSRVPCISGMKRTASTSSSVVLHVASRSEPSCQVGISRASVASRIFIASYSLWSSVRKRSGMVPLF